MDGDIGDALAVDIDFAAVMQAIDVFRTGKRARFAGADAGLRVTVLPPCS
jgi:hypothetical protein